MKKFFTSILLFIGITNILFAQDNNTNTQTTASSSISKSLGLYVFPSKNQDQKTMDADEMECYKWAIQQTGYDPLNPTVVQAQQAKKSGAGSTVKGSAGGAAVGAAIGAIAGDAGEGAAIGAVAGGLRGRRQGKKQQAAQQQQNNQAAADQTKALKDNYIKAFSACMEGKGYTVE